MLVPSKNNETYQPPHEETKMRYFNKFQCLLYTILCKVLPITRYKEEVVPDHKEARGYNRVKKV